MPSPPAQQSHRQQAVASLRDIAHAVEEMPLSVVRTSIPSVRMGQTLGAIHRRGPTGFGAMVRSLGPMPREVFSIFFHLDRPAALDLTLRARVPVGQSRLVARVDDQTLNASIWRVYAEIQDLMVSSDTAGLVLDDVTSNRGNMFYWGRRGPSVHLR